MNVDLALRLFLSVHLLMLVWLQLLRRVDLLINGLIEFFNKRILWLLAVEKGTVEVLFTVYDVNLGLLVHCSRLDTVLQILTTHFVGSLDLGSCDVDINHCLLVCDDAREPDTILCLRIWTLGPLFKLNRPFARLKLGLLRFDDVKRRLFLNRILVSTLVPDCSAVGAKALGSLLLEVIEQGGVAQVLEVLLAALLLIETLAHLVRSNLLGWTKRCGVLPRAEAIATS